MAFRDFKHLVDLVSDLVQFSDGPPPPRAALTPKPESAASPQKPAALAPAVVPPRPMSAKEASELVGSRIRLYNVRHRKYYPVTVETVQEDQHTVKFENGSEQTVNLSKEKWQMVEEAQQAPKPEHKSPPAGELAPQLKPQASTAPADSRPVTRQARDVGASRHGGASTSAAPAVLDAMNITPLQYKLSLSRDDNIERARQLARALRSLMPASRDVIGSGKSRAELDNAFRRLTGKDAPKIDYGVSEATCSPLLFPQEQYTEV